MSASGGAFDGADVVVVGAGPAGSVAAFTLASLGHDVIVVDQRSFPRPKACGDGLTSSAVSFLAELGLSAALDGAQPIEGSRLVSDWRPGRVEPLPGSAAPGRHPPCCIPRLAFDAALLGFAMAAGARFIEGRVDAAVLRDGCVSGVDIGDRVHPAMLSARHVIAADGATSRLRRQLMPARAEAAVSYAARQYVRTEEPLPRIFDIYAPLADPLYGYGWVFPVSERLANVGVGYVTAPGLARPRPITGTLEWFAGGVQRHFGPQLGALESVGASSGGRLSVNFAAERCEVAGVTFVGDAARTCDPITGEGIDRAMRSAHLAAVALDAAIKRGRSPSGVGRAFARANPRLGQDSAMIARLGHELLRRRRPVSSHSGDAIAGAPPLFSAGRAMLTAAVDYPSLWQTPAGRAAAEISDVHILAAVDDRIRDDLQTEFVLATELAYRELCAGAGPTGALATFAVHRACRGASEQGLVDAVVCTELLRAFRAMLSRVVPGVDAEARANNALTLLAGDHCLARASAAASALGMAATTRFAVAIEASSEAVALAAHDRHATERTTGRYLEWARLGSGSNISLALQLGAGLAGADEATVGALASAGVSLGVALQICEDVEALTRIDPITGGQPQRTLREGEMRLPVILAGADDASLAGALGEHNDSAAWERTLMRIKGGHGLRRAAEMCEQYATHARAEMSYVLGEHHALAIVGDLPRRCLAAAGVLPSGEIGTPPRTRAGRLRLAS